MKHITLLALLSLAPSALPAAEQDFSKVEIKATHVSGNVYMLTGEGGNIGVSTGEDGIVIVDDQFAPLADKIRAALKGITGKPLRFVINTHYHSDHTGGNKEFQKDAPVIAHENVRKRLQSGSTINLAGTILETAPSPKEALPIITFDHTMTLHLNGEDIRALHYPSGHTDSDSIIFFSQSNVVHMGDDFVTRGFPFIDQANGGSVAGMIAALDDVAATLPSDVKVIPGHGEISSLDDIARFSTMLKETRAAVQQAINQGKSLEQMKQDKILAPWSKQPTGFITPDVFIEILYAELMEL